MRKFIAFIGILLSGLWLLNFGMGFILEIPDALPFIGHVDEFIASGILFTCLSEFGIRLPMRKKPPKE